MLLFKRLSSTVLLLVVLVVFVSSSIAKPLHDEALDGFYLSPKPGASWVHSSETLLLRPWKASLTQASNYAIEQSSVTGSLSGKIDGNWTLGTDGRTSIFKHPDGFQTGESIHVDLIVRLDGVSKRLAWDFSVCPEDEKQLLAAAHAGLDDWKQQQTLDTDQNANVSMTEHSGNAISQRYDLPLSLPDYTIAQNGQTQGQNLFIAPFPSDRSAFLHLVMNPTGTVQFCDVVDFYAQIWIPNDEAKRIVAYQPSWPSSQFLLYDTTFTQIETIIPGNGFPADDHELNILPNGHVLILARDFRIMDFTNLVMGGLEDEVVTGMVVQELSAPDANGQRDVLFQWKSLDDTTAIRVTDAIGGVNYITGNVDYMHANSIERAQDGNYVVSCRHLSQLIKIDSETGDLLWRFGRAGMSNDFTIENDPVDFSGQHDARQLENGHWLFFDNGTYDAKGYARAVEYSLDETNRVATLVWQYDHGQQFRSNSRGSTQRLANGNTLICWGNPGAGNPQATEVDASGNIVWEINFASNASASDPTILYQVHWSTLNIVPDVPVLNWEITDEGAVRLLFAKYGDDAVTGYHIFVDETPAPDQLYKDTTATSMVLPWMDPSSGFVHARVKAYYNDGSESGFSNEVEIDLTKQGIKNPSQIPQPEFPWLTVNAYPNPFNSTARILVTVGGGRLTAVELYNLLGRKVGEFPLVDHATQNYSWNLDSSSLSSGTYLIRARSADGHQATGRVVLVK